MEVLHASAPGAQVRVMRAAYHSSSGPGLPASSYLMHSSRQVLSSGNDFLEVPSAPIQPLEISSTPLDVSPDSECEKENYKVTEPDDFDISEPSKWRASSSKSSLRMPSEESSSTDNASIIDLDPLTSRKSTFRRSFREKDKDASTNHKRISPLLDAPVALSTLKYTSLLSGCDEWTDRRKSYSFEDTSPLYKGVRGSDSITIDSSTDSGIYKSTEIIDDQNNNTKKGNINYEDNTFQDWLFRNRSSKFKNSQPLNESDEFIGNNISLKSGGKVTITVPITIESDKSANSSKSDIFEMNDRKSKKVEFCKTELHFAADSGTVNIIATDEKPPPSNDFRKRRSAFVPLNDRYDKSITLFGDKVNQSESVLNNEIITTFESVDNENTAATKSILKNKIPKPKPYLLGENMDIGGSKTNNNIIQNDTTVLSAVSLINRQFQSRLYNDETTSSKLNDLNTRTRLLTSLRTNNEGPENKESIDIRNKVKNPEKVTVKMMKNENDLSPLLSSQRNTRSREIRFGDLKYFGINKTEEPSDFKYENSLQEILHSVKLVQQVSNSVSNSEIDSDDAPEYENLPASSHFKIPTPKPRSKYKKGTDTLNTSSSLKPIPEQTNDLRTSSLSRCKLKKDVKQCCNMKNTDKPKSPSYEPKQTTNSTSSLRRSKNEDRYVSTRNGRTSPKIQNGGHISPVYVNLKVKKEEINNIKTNKMSNCVKTLRNERNSKENERRDIVTSVPKEDINLPHTTRAQPVRQSFTSKNNTLQRVHKSNTSNKHRNDKEDNITKESKNTTARNSTKEKKPVKEINHKESDVKLLKYVKENKVKDLTEKPSHALKQGNDNKENKYVRNHHNSNGLSAKTQTDTFKSESISDSKSDTLLIEDNKRSTKDYTKKPKRSQYVINYDDKHGTVSSICKIKPGTGSHRRKTSKEDKNISPGHKTDVTNKNASLQHADQERITGKTKIRLSKKKHRVSKHNSCRLL